jgi:hypothetical protein
MDRVLMIIQHIILCTPCITLLLVSHTYTFVIDHAEQGPKEPPKPTQVEDANPEQEQGKPQYINQCSFYYIYVCVCVCVCFTLIVH